MRGKSRGRGGDAFWGNRAERDRLARRAARRVERQRHQMEKGVPWARLCGVIAPHSPQGGAGASADRHRADAAPFLPPAVVWAGRCSSGRGARRQPGEAPLLPASIAWSAPRPTASPRRAPPPYPSRCGSGRRRSRMASIAGHIQLAKRFRGQSGVLGDAGHGKGVDQIVARDGQAHLSVGHHRVLAFMGDAKAELGKDAHGDGAAGGVAWSRFLRGES